MGSAEGAQQSLLFSLDATKLVSSSTNSCSAWRLCPNLEYRGAPQRLGGRGAKRRGTAAAACETLSLSLLPAAAGA